MNEGVVVIAFELGEHVGSEGNVLYRGVFLCYTHCFLFVLQLEIILFLKQFRILVSQLEQRVIIRHHRFIHLLAQQRPMLFPHLKRGHFRSKEGC